MRLQTNFRERIANRLTRGDLSRLRSDVVQLDLSLEHVKEAMVELEANYKIAGGALSTISGAGGKNNDFSRTHIKNVSREGRLKYFSSPLIRRCVDVSALYTFAQGVTVHCVDDEKANATLQEFWDNKKNRKAFTSILALFTKEIERKTSGNLFLALFAERGKIAQIRAVPADEIEEVITNPEDAAEVWYYKRVWSAKTTDLETGITSTAPKTAYYPSLELISDGGEIRQQIGDAEVMPAALYHVKTGCFSDMDFGVADTYPAHTPDSTYKEFLEDRASVAASLSVFAWMGKAKQGVARMLSGVGAQVAGIRNALRGGSNVPAGQIGAIGADSEMNPVNVASATIDPDEGRAFRIAAVGAMGLSEPLGTGDVSTGNLATAESLDWPTSLMFMLTQAMWEEVFTDIASYVLSAAGYNPSKAGITVDWPPIIHQNTADTLNAINTASAHLPGIEGKKFIARRVVSALGEDKVDEIVNNLDFTETPAPMPTNPNPTGANN